MPMSKRPDFLACVMMALSVSVKYLNSLFCRSTGMPRILKTQANIMQSLSHPHARTHACMHAHTHIPVQELAHVVVVFVQHKHTWHVLTVTYQPHTHQCICHIWNIIPMLLSYKYMKQLCCTQNLHWLCYFSW